MTLTVVAIAVFLGVLGAGLTVAVAADRVRQASRLRARLRLAVSSAQAAAPPPKRSAGVRALASALLQLAADRLLPHDPWGTRPSATRLFAMGLAASAAMALLGVLLKLPAWVSGVAFVATFPVAVRILVAQADKAQALKFDTKFPETVDHLVRMLQAGLPVTSSIRRLARDTEAPVSRVYEDVANWLDVGMPLSQALLVAGRDLNVDAFAFFGSALSIQSITGGNLILTLENLAAIMRERQLQTAKVRALTSDARTTALIIVILPLAASLLMRIVLPDYIGVLFSSPANLAVLGVAVGCYLMGVVTVRTMLARLGVA